MFDSNLLTRVPRVRARVGLGLGYYLDITKYISSTLTYSPGYLAGDEDYYTHVHCYNFKNNNSPETLVSPDRKVLMCGKDLRDGLKPVADDYNGRYSTHLFVERAKRIIKGHAKKYGPNNKKVIIIFPKTLIIIIIKRWLLK